jgi:hypothetical protein
MTTASTSTVIDQTSDAAFRTWVAEIITQLVTTCGVTQTTDTGQINTSTVTRATANTAAGNVILKFNDTLQSTSAVFIKLEFGSAAANTTPQMWITIGTGSNGSGTLTGTTSVRAAVLNGNAPSSTTTSYTSRYIYNSTFGYLGLIFKIGSSGTAGVGQGGFVLFRSNDATGASTGDSVNLITNSGTASGATNSTTAAVMQCLSFGSSAMFPSTVANGVFWAAGGANGTNIMPFNLASTTTGGNSYVSPVYYMTPVPSVSAFNCVGLLSEAALGSTFSAALVGSTSLTFLSVQTPFGGAFFGGANISTDAFCMLWQ